MTTAPSKSAKAPDFTLPDQNGNPVTLSSLAGGKVALYFYPKDMTPGCTIQACNLRDNYASLKQSHITILGISPDSLESHLNFIDKKSLPFTLLSDADHAVLTLYGAWGEKNSFGNKHMGVIRTTILIDEKGNIIKIIAKPEVGDHAQEIIDGFKENKS